MNVATQVTLSVLVLILAGWSVYRESVIGRLRKGRRELYKRGLLRGGMRERRYWLNRRRVELHNAGRLADVRSDSGPPARVTQIKFHRRHDL